MGFSREEYIYYTDHFHEPILTDLVGRDAIAEEDLMETAMMQRAARRLLEKAVEEVEVADWDHITLEERDALKAAARDALHESDLDLSAVEKFEAALENEIAEYTTTFLGEGPAFMFVRQEDWPWLIALHPPLNAARHIHDSSVGSRDVLLLANEAGAELVGETSP